MKDKLKGFIAIWLFCAGILAVTLLTIVLAASAALLCQQGNYIECVIVLAMIPVPVALFTTLVE